MGKEFIRKINTSPDKVEAFVGVKEKQSVKSWTRLTQTAKGLTIELYS
ncbi:hypothetical protein ACLUWT_04075 [Limosilactobacillus mucosae]